MKPSDLLRAAHERFFTTETNSIAGALRGDVEYPVYCRALFHLKRGFGIDPRDTLFAFDRSDEIADVVASGFERAIAFAYAQEAAASQ